MSASLPVTDRCPAYSSFFGVMGATSAMVLTGKNSALNSLN